MNLSREVREAILQEVMSGHREGARVFSLKCKFDHANPVLKKQ